MSAELEVTDTEVIALADEIDALLDALKPVREGEAGDGPFSAVMTALELVIVRRMVAIAPTQLAALQGANMAAKHLIAMAALLGRDLPSTN